MEAEDEAPDGLRHSQEGNLLGANLAHIAVLTSSDEPYFTPPDIAQNSPENVELEVLQLQASRESPLAGTSDDHVLISNRASLQERIEQSLFRRVTERRNRHRLLPSIPQSLPSNVRSRSTFQTQPQTLTDDENVTNSTETPPPSSESLVPAQVAQAASQSINDHQVLQSVNSESTNLSVTPPVSSESLPQLPEVPAGSQEERLSYEIRRSLLRRIPKRRQVLPYPPSRPSSSPVSVTPPSTQPEPSPPAPSPFYASSGSAHSNGAAPRRVMVINPRRRGQANPKEAFGG